VPRTILYQGTLTDDSGVPLPDNTYFIRFRIWSDSISNDAGQEKWNGNIQAVNVYGGLLEAVLGAPPMPPLPNNIFANDTNLYLGISVGVAAELRPRIKFTTVPYAYKALLADTAAIAKSTAPNSVNGNSIVDGSVTLLDLAQSGATTGKVIKWDGSQWSPATDANSGGDISSIVVGSGLAGGGDSGAVSIYVPPNGISSVQIAPNAVGNSQISVYAVGSPQLAPSAVTQSKLAPSAVGTTEIIDNSILGVDISDEPGLAQNRSANIIALNNISMTDLVTVTLTTPAAGFIFLMGRTSLTMQNTTAENRAHLQIDETTGGVLIGGIYSTVGFESYPTTGAYNFNCTSQRTYFKTAGTYTFRLEALQVTTSGSANINASYPILTAMYFPTSYGSVTTAGEKSDTPVSDK